MFEKHAILFLNRIVILQWWFYWFKLHQEYAFKPNYFDEKLPFCSVNVEVEAQNVFSVIKKSKSCILNRLRTFFNMKRIRQNLKYLSACMKKFNKEILHREVDDLRSRQNETKRYLQLRWKPLKSNFQRYSLQ